MSERIQGIWEPQTGQYQRGEQYRVGPILVASVFYSATVSKGDANKIGTSVELPGLKRLGHFPSMEDAKARVEKQVAAWFSAALSPKQAKDIE